MARQLDHLLENGSFRQTNYREVGAAIFPFMTYLIEGSKLSLQPSFQDIYPTSRYVAFVLFTTSILYLGRTLWYIESFAVGISFMLLAATFFPFIVDLYFPDSDAMFLFLFPLFTSFLLRTRYTISNSSNSWKNILGLLCVFFVMGMTKVIPIFLTIVAPIVFLFPFERPQLRKALLSYGFLSILLFTVFISGGATSNLFQHPERNIGIEGEKFQDTVGWHMIWAANGVFDHYSAHGFTKSARLRNQRVSDATGLPAERTYIRHSQSATEHLYRPAVKQALRERPGYFYSTAFLRFYNHGLRFFRYTYGGDNSSFWESWFDDGNLGTESISGQEVFKLTRERNAIRYDQAWKISPLVLNAKITQGDMTRLTDLTLLSCAFFGMILSRHKGFTIFLIICGSSQIVFSSLIHGINRYLMFCSIALLIGLSIFLCRIMQVMLSTKNFQGKHSGGGVDKSIERLKRRNQR